MRKRLKGYDYDYHIDNTGNVFKGSRLIKSQDNGIGYLNIKLWQKKKRIHKYIHRLVWETFKGEIPQGYEVNHIDHNKHNNSLDNLELVSHSVNMKKSIEKYGPYGFLKK